MNVGGFAVSSGAGILLERFGQSDPAELQLKIDINLHPDFLGIGCELIGIVISVFGH
jgi:hypothetical protein